MYCEAAYSVAATKFRLRAITMHILTFRMPLWFPRLHSWPLSFTATLVMCQ